jgi:cell division protein FtsL
MMVRLNLVLAVLVLLSCVWLVRSSYDSRHLFVELEKAKSQAHELQVDYERLEVDKRAQSASMRVEKLARDKLHMFPRTDIAGATRSYGASAAAPAMPHDEAMNGAASGGQP